MTTCIEHSTVTMTTSIEHSTVTILWLSSSRRPSTCYTTMYSVPRICRPGMPPCGIFIFGDVYNCSTWTVHTYTTSLHMNDTLLTWTQIWTVNVLGLLQYNATVSAKFLQNEVSQHHQATLQNIQLYSALDGPT